MKWQEDKYFKKAVKVLGVKPLIEKSKSINDLSKIIDKWNLYLDTLNHNLDVARNNIRVCPDNIEQCKDYIKQLKELSEQDHIRYYYNKNQEIKEAIDEMLDLLYENEESLLKAKKDILEIPKTIETVTNMLEKYLLQVEPQMKIERMTELNKGKNYVFSHV